MSYEDAPLAGPEARADGGHCRRCGSVTVPFGFQTLEVGRPGGGFLASLAGHGEGIIDVELLVCDTCRRIELRAPDSWYRE